MGVAKTARICIVGAGPAGLATAHRLHAEGFTKVTVLEKLPQLGGLCLTYEFEGRAFDLGANYVTDDQTGRKKNDLIKQLQKLGYTVSLTAIA